MANFNQNLMFNGLGTLTIPVTIAGTYNINGHTSLPTLTSAGIVSSVVTTVNQNGTPVFTSVAGAEGFGAQVSCAATDILTVVYSSAAPNDQLRNVIKSVVSIG